nr:hypothetical protein [Bacillus fungorum]
MAINNDTPVEELRMLGEEFQNKFSIHHLQELAYQTGMIQRKRKFQAQDLVSLCVFLGQTISSESLVSLCTKLNEATGTCLSAEALNKRWNKQVYQKGEDGNWILLHMESLTKNLEEGETIELPEVYFVFM